LKTGVNGKRNIKLKKKTVAAEKKKSMGKAYQSVQKKIGLGSAPEMHAGRQ
jgi:hypothetical protein